MVFHDASSCDIPRSWTSWHAHCFFPCNSLWYNLSHGFLFSPFDTLYCQYMPILCSMFKERGNFDSSWDITVFPFETLSSIFCFKSMAVLVAHETILSTGLFIFPLEHYITLWHAMITMLSLGSGGVDSAWDNLISNGPPLYPWTLGWLMGMGGWTLELYQWYNPSTVLILLVRRRGC
jgi:hypothetical protein